MHSQQPTARSAAGRQAADGDTDARNAAADRAMAAYARGDDAAFERLYGLVSRELWAFIYSRVGHRVDSEDVMQRTFLQVHRARGRFRPGARVRPWLFTIAWRLIIDRSRARRVQVELDPAAYLDPKPTPHDQAVAAQLGARLRSAFEQLPERQQAAFALTRSTGLSQAEVAEALGTSTSAVKSLVHRALGTLERIYGEAGGRR